MSLCSVGDMQQVQPTPNLIKEGGLAVMPYLPFVAAIVEIVVPRESRNALILHIHREIVRRLATVAVVAIARSADRVVLAAEIALRPSVVVTENGLDVGG